MIHSDWQPARIKSRNSLLKLSEAKEIFAPTHRRARRDGLRWYFSSALSPFLWFTACQAQLPVGSQTNFKLAFTDLSKPVQESNSEPSITEEEFKMQIFFLWICSWSNGRIFSLEGCTGAPAMWVCTKHHRRAALCFPTVILLFQLKQSAGHCLENSHLPRLCGQCLKMKVSIQRDFSAAW